MGGGSSTPRRASATPPPACPVFYNFSPSAQHIPASTLPSRDARGNVRRPQGGCAARIIALRHLPVVTAEAKREAKEFLSNVSKMRKAKEGDEAALAKLAEVEEQAKAIQHDPSLTPAVSSCFLVNIAVDEQGRLAPLSTDGAAGLTDTMNLSDPNGDSDSASESGSTAPAAQAHPPTRKGFNFEAASSVTNANHNNNANANYNSPTQVHGGGSPAPPASTQRKSPQLTIIPTPGPDGATGRNNNNNNALASLPSPRSGRTPPLPAIDATPVQRLSHPTVGDAAPAVVTAPPPLLGPSMMPTIFAPPIAAVSDNDVDNDESDSNGLMSASTRSLLIKDSRYRRSDGAETNAAQVVAAVAALGDPTTTRLRRQNSRIKLMQVPNRTRWFLFNDSSTHEAEVRVMFCYAKPTDAAAAAHNMNNAGFPAKGQGRQGSGSSGSPPKVSSAYAAAPGEMKLMCVPTPLSHTATAAKDVKKQLANMSSSSRSFVEVEPLTVNEFINALPTPSAEAQRELLAKFQANSARMEAVSVFVVLAPGATVFLSEGEATGYMVETHMIPFNSSTSMAVTGRLLTPELVVSTKHKNAALVKDCYRHKLIYLAHQPESKPMSAATAVGNGSPAILAPTKPVPYPGTFAAIPEQRSGSVDNHNNANNPHKRVSGQGGAAGPTASGGNKPNHLHSSTYETGDGVADRRASALPPIQTTKPYPLPPAAAMEPVLVAGDTTGAPAAAVAAAPILAAPDQQQVQSTPPPPHQQQRLSRRSPSTTPTNAAGEAVAKGGEPAGSPPRRKRIGSMLRNPDAAGMPGKEDDPRDRSFHRDLPSTNSFAISF